jgi:uncharacterized membrane protein YeiB
MSLAFPIPGAGRAASWARIFAAPGRLGLTNYLPQSVVMTGFYAQYALGLTVLAGAWTTV